MEVRRVLKKFKRRKKLMRDGGRGLGIVVEDTGPRVASCGVGCIAGRQNRITFVL